jgi:hypothetical protein
MTELAATQPVDTVSHQGLLSRAVGSVVAPRATYAAVTARPTAMGALAIILILMVTPTAAFLSTDIGKDAMLDRQVRTMESLGFEVPDQMYERLEDSLQYGPYLAAVNQILFVPLMAALVAAVLFVAFTAVMGGEATFRQLFAVVVHSGFVLALAPGFTAPLNYARQTLSSATNLLVFAPFLDETSFAARLLGAIDLFYIWWIVNLSIGLGVLYRRRTAPIAMGLLMTYGALALAVAAALMAFSGA